jgi:hypothetical protein
MPPNHFDQAARFAAKLDAPAFLAWVLGVAPESLGFVSWIDTRAIPFPGAPDRTSDTVARLEPPGGTEPPWALALEFQTEPDAGMFARLLEYLSHLWASARPDAERGSRFNVGAAVVNLTGTGYASRAMALPGTRVETKLTVAERNLASESADDTVGRIERAELGRALLPWVPLMRGGGSVTIVDRWKVLALLEPDHRRRSELAGLALVFAEASDVRPTWETELKGWNVRESQVVNGWIAEGRAEGRAEGQLGAFRAGVVAVLEARFGTVPSEVVAAITANGDADQLQAWLAFAARAADLAAFRVAAGIQ